MHTNIEKTSFYIYEEYCTEPVNKKKQLNDPQLIVTFGNVYLSIQVRYSHTKEGSGLLYQHVNPKITLTGKQRSCQLYIAYMNHAHVYLLQYMEQNVENKAAIFASQMHF